MLLLFWTKREFTLFVGVNLKLKPNELFKLLLLLLKFVLVPPLLNNELFPAPLILILDPLNIPELFILNGFILLFEFELFLSLILLFILLFIFAPSLILILLEDLLLLLEKLILK